VSASTATSSTGVRFVDTNVLLYAVSRDPEERHKAERARGILSERDLALSVQVLQEFYVQATRESRPDPLTHDQAARLVESFLRFRLADVTREVMLAAIATHRRFQISYWDAAILEAARSLGCETVLSEDLGDGQDYDGVHVENPFRAAKDSDLLVRSAPSTRG
jgi:predicted nucleic acid-binding protein